MTSRRPCPPQAYTRDDLEQMEIDALDFMAFGVTGGQVVSLSPAQINIRYGCDLENPEAMFKKKGMSWAQSVDLSEPVDVSVDDKGDFYLEDGHHRWFAAGKTARQLSAKLEIKGRPIEKILADQALSCGIPAPRRPMGP
jgi:hypothetical protein